jgi:hypothetical protein
MEAPVTARFLMLAAGIAASLPASALAQDTGAAPTYGSVQLSSGFTPDPYSVSLTAGGSVDASRLGSSCRGKIANAPDFDLYYTPGSFPLTIYATSDADTTLVVNTPSNQWYCIDDVNGMNPSITFSSPESGLYDIWVGTYADSLQDATLYITELGDGGATAAASGQPDFTATPTFGSVVLTAGFSPDPYQMPITAGGSLSASTLGAGCVGRIATAPDFSLNYTAGSFPLYITANSSSDTTLVINTPNGGWVCDDDGARSGSDPLVTFAKPASGRYDIWVGTYGDSNVSSTLIITEVAGR